MTVYSLHIAKSEVASYAPAGRVWIDPARRQMATHGKGDRLDRSSPPLGRNAKHWTGRLACAGRSLVNQNRQRRGVVRELDWPDGDARREVALRSVSLANRSKINGAGIGPHVGIESTRRCVPPSTSESRGHLVASEGDWREPVPRPGRCGARAQSVSLWVNRPRPQSWRAGTRHGIRCSRVALVSLSSSRWTAFSKNHV